MEWIADSILPLSRLGNRDRSADRLWPKYCSERSIRAQNFLSLSPGILDRTAMTLDDNIVASIDVINVGKRKGDEVSTLRKGCKNSVVRRDEGLSASVVKSRRKPNASVRHKQKMLSFYDIDMKYGTEKGKFELMIGNSSRNQDLQTATFFLE